MRKRNREAENNNKDLVSGQTSAEVDYARNFGCYVFQ
jgi:hypothetical protein